MRGTTQRPRPARLLGRPLARALLGATLATAGVASVLLGTLLPVSAVAAADGPAPCSVGGPPFPFRGFCATYSNANTWYGSYGPGFPTDEGWAFCADPPASGGFYPAPDYDYVASGPPSGADTASAPALGFAFSEAEAMGWWDGSVGQFTADQAAVAGKLLYDALVWGSPVPSMDPGVLAAFNAINDWFNQASGTSGVAQLSLELVGGGASFAASASVEVALRFPGTGNGLAGVGVSLTISNGTFDTPGGPTTIGVSTDGSGVAVVPIFNDGGGTVTVAVSTTSAVGQADLQFYAPTAREPNAQQLAAFHAPTSLDQTLQLSAAATTGTVSIQKSGDDTAYYGLEGAVFEVLDSGGRVAATLTTNATGRSPASGALAPGSYTVHEVTPPDGYAVAADQTVAVAAGTNTVVSYSGDFEEHVVPATLEIDKTDVEDGAALAGAVFDVAFDPSNDGTFSDDLGTCTTDGSGGCSPPGNDGSGLLPGDYRITEVTAPSGYYLDPAQATEDTTLSPGQHGTVGFADLHLGSIEVDKTGDDASYAAVIGATFSLEGPVPAATPVGVLTVGSDGRSNVIGSLVPGTYTLTETTPPPGYEASSPVSVAVRGGLEPTVVDVLDHVQPGSLSLVKVDRETNALLAGAIFDVRYDSGNSGTYDQDLGQCTTDAGGACGIAGNDGTGSFLPGNYEVTELAAPPGYALEAADVTQHLSLLPGGTGVVTFDDPKLVAATFTKLATGNVDPATVSLQGAVFAIADASGSGPTVTTCTTDATGDCTTAAVLAAGDRYCWSEPTAPPGLVAGASGCFTAANDQGATPIDVTDRGEFVNLTVDKVDAANPAVTLSGVVFDLYRVDDGNGPDQPAPPPGAPTEDGETWTARATTGTDGLAHFPLQFPGFAYCAVENAPPPNYVADPHQHCTAVLDGDPTVPPPANNLVIGNTEATVTVAVHKFDVLQPGTGIPGATYDLYVEGPLPPGDAHRQAPAEAATEPGDAWYARGTTANDGVLDFTVPAGHAWCIREVTAPPDYLLDPALHCTAVLTVASTPDATSVALPETRAVVHLSAYKYNALSPNTTIPDATYELLAQGSDPPGGPGAAPAGLPVPSGDTFWGEATTDTRGVLSFAVPAGYSWCLHEVEAPADYRSDPAFHCTAVLTADSPVADSTLAVPEVPAHGELAFTGTPTVGLLVVGSLLITGGTGLLLVARRPRPSRTRRRAPRHARRARERPRPGRRTGVLVGVVLALFLSLGAVLVVPRLASAAVAGETPASGPGGCVPGIAPTVSILSGDGQSIAPNQAGLPLVVLVACQSADATVPITGAAVTWAAEAGATGAGGSLGATASTTDGSGQATVEVSSNDQPGRWYAVASIAPRAAPPGTTTTTRPPIPIIAAGAEACSPANPCTENPLPSPIRVVFDLVNVASAPAGTPPAPSTTAGPAPTVTTAVIGVRSLAYTGGPSPLVVVVGAGAAAIGLAVSLALGRRRRQLPRR